MEYEGRFWKNSFRRVEKTGPFPFTVEAGSAEEAKKEAQRKLLQIDSQSRRRATTDCEIFIDGHWASIYNLIAHS
ncbi:MAG: hypothetical protein HYW70_02155 [Candidatus Nealsonbacteria bacterium]|nr:hypothetical protein [Candidatus Nealsonbacteria bacterium]